MLLVQQTCPGDLNPRVAVVTQSLSRVRLFCNPTDCSPPGSSVHVIFQGRMLEWVVTSSAGELPDPGIQSYKGPQSLLCLYQVKVAQSCLTLCDRMDYTVHGILQASILEWIAFPFSRGSSQPRDRTQVSRIAGGFFTS